MKLSEIDVAIERCDQHLTDTNAFGTEIEAFLTRYLLVHICAAFEQVLRDLIIRRASTSQDPYIEAFVRSTTASIVRSIKTSEIAGILGRFGSDYKEVFTSKVNESRAEQCFNSIVVNRHSTAHASGSSMTFRDLEAFYLEAHTVLDVVEATLFGIDSEAISSSGSPYL